jgi:hypothetical protein
VIHLSRNVDLAEDTGAISITGARHSKIEGWETDAANAFDVAFFTANWKAAFSLDAGNHFAAVSPYDLIKPLGLNFCCDQGVTYEPRINSFLWVLLSNEGPIVMAVASPEQIRESRGRSWTVYEIPPSAFRRENDAFDYPEVTFGDNFVYMTANLMTGGGALIIRMPIGEIAERTIINARYAFIRDSSFICPAQLTGERGWFGTMQSDSSLRIFSWRESSLSVEPPFDIPIASVPTDDFHSFTPDHEDWLPETSKIGWDVTGAARSGQELWLAWSAGRKISGHRENAVAQPHIEIAVVNIQSKKLIRQRYIWNPDFAFAWPSLAANPAQEVAMSFAWGGGAFYPQHAVGILKAREDFVSTTSGPSAGAGGHYVRVRMAFPKVDEFVAGGYVAVKVKGKVANHPHYVVFRS